LFSNRIARVFLSVVGILIFSSVLTLAENTECKVNGLLLPAVQIANVSNQGEQIEVKINNIQGEGTLGNCNGADSTSISGQKISVDIDLILRIPRRDLGRSSGISVRGQAKTTLTIPGLGGGLVSSHDDTTNGGATCVTRQGKKHCEFRIDFPVTDNPDPSSSSPLALAISTDFKFTFLSLDPSKDWDLEEIEVRNALVGMYPSRGIIGSPPSNSPGSGASNLRDFDSDNNCRMGDSEFFGAVDSWISQLVDNNLFFSAVDAWIGNSNICAAVASSGVTLQLSDQALTISSLINNAPTSVIIYDVQGSRVFAQNTLGSKLEWNLRNPQAEKIANGIYFARIGNSNILKKFVVMR
jgi:hypothetical protein